MSNIIESDDEELTFPTPKIVKKMKYEYQEPEPDYDDFYEQNYNDEQNYGEEYYEEYYNNQYHDEPTHQQQQEQEVDEEELERKQNEEFIQMQKKFGLMCSCGLNTVLREVKKDGPNKGKMFYTCQNVYDKKCNHFMWKDESDKKMGKNAKTEEKVIENENAKQVETERPIENVQPEIDYKHQQKIGLMCYCKLPSVLREVKKDGPTKGKMFYTCSRYYNDKCKYFVWK